MNALVGDTTGLPLLDQFCNRGEEEGDHDLRNDPVDRIRYGDGASVFDEPCQFFGEEEAQGKVKSAWWEDAAHHHQRGSKEKGSKQIHELPNKGERNTVWPGA